MRLLWTAISLALLQCNYGDDEFDVIIDDELISDIFKRVPSSRPNKCGVRNNNFFTFNLMERDNEAQFGEFVMESEMHIDQTQLNEMCRIHKRKIIQYFFSETKFFMYCLSIFYNIS